MPPGGRESGDGPISQMNDASRSMPISVVAAPHTTGNTVADATPLLVGGDENKFMTKIALLMNPPPEKPKKTPGQETEET